MRTTILFVTLIIQFTIVGCRYNSLENYSHYPKLEFDIVLENGKKALTIKTLLATEGRNFNVANDMCTLSVVRMNRDTIIPAALNYEVENYVKDHLAFSSIWIIPDSLLIYDSLRISACTSDITGKSSCDTTLYIKKNKNGSLDAHIF